MKTERLIVVAAAGAVAGCLSVSADTVTNLVVEGGIQQGTSTATVATAAAFGISTVATGRAAFAEGEGTDALAPYSHAGGYDAVATNFAAFIHAYQQQTLFDYTAHFNRLILFEPASTSAS